MFSRPSFWCDRFRGNRFNRTCNEEFLSDRIDNDRETVRCIASIDLNSNRWLTERNLGMAYAQKTAIVTGASQGIGAGLVDAIAYLTEAKQVTGEVLHVDGGAHVGKW
jgi:hypothetical protein